MTDHPTRFRLADLLALFAAAITLIAGIGALARDNNGNSSSASVAIVSNGMVTSMIANGAGGLEISSNAPGMITISSGSNSVSLRGDYVTLSGVVTLAPGATPGVTVTPNEQGGYTVILDPPTEFDLGK
jgi:DNA/RNA endonuclease YhcR with UshA esterase domain